MRDRIRQHLYVPLNVVTRCIPIYIYTTITQKGVQIKNICNIINEFVDLFIIVLSQTK